MAYYHKTILIALTVVLVSCTKSHEPTVEESAQRDSLLIATVRKQNLVRTLAVVDSMEKAGAISATKADFFRGRAYDEGWQMYLAEHYYRKAYEGCTKPIQDWRLFAESGYRLSTVLGMRLEIDSSLSLAIKLIDVANKEPRFPIVYKAFLLNNIAWCQQTLHQNDESVQNYMLAYETLKTEKGKINEGQYYSDMYNMTIDIIDHYYMTGDFQNALMWTQRCEEHYRQYALQPNVHLKGENGAHVMLRKAVILTALGREKEAEEVYRTVDLNMIKNPPGITWQGRYLMATGHYREAADCYARLDTTYIATDRAKASFDFISERLLPRFEANLKAGRTRESLELGSAIHQMLDSVILIGKKTRAAELSTIYETQKKELALKNYSFKVRFYQYALVAVVAILLFICWLSLHMRRLYKILMVKNRQMFEEMQSKMKESSRYVEQLQDSPKEKLNANQKLYLQICQAMENQKLYTQPDINREKLAAIMFTNYKYVAAAVRECTNGLTVNQFINNYRVRHAARLLAESDQPITLIIDMVGFNNRSNFNKIFREYFKLSPSEYRRAAKGEGMLPEPRIEVVGEELSKGRSDDNNERP